MKHIVQALTSTRIVVTTFKLLEVVSRYRDSQPQVVENHSYLFNLTPRIYINNQTRDIDLILE